MDNKATRSSFLQLLRPLFLRSRLQQLLVEVNDGACAQQHQRLKNKAYRMQQMVNLCRPNRKPFPAKAEEESRIEPLINASHFHELWVGMLATAGGITWTSGSHTHIAPACGIEAAAKTLEIATAINFCAATPQDL
eukprot:3488273-Amphidinium_carterae.2